MPSNHLILCFVSFFSCLQSFPASGFFSNESVLPIRWPQYWSFSYSIRPSNEYSGLISFWMDWLNLLSVQEILKSLLQHHSSKASILQHSTFFMVQLSHPYMTTRNTIALTRWTFVSKVMSLLFNRLSGLVIAFLPRSKHLFISWLLSPSAVILEPPKIKSLTISAVSPSICHNLVLDCYGCSKCFKVILSLLNTSMDALESCILNYADYTHQQFVSFDWLLISPPHLYPCTFSLWRYISTALT